MEESILSSLVITHSFMMNLYIRIYTLLLLLLLCLIVSWYKLDVIGCHYDDHVSVNF